MNDELSMASLALSPPAFYQFPTLFTNSILNISRALGRSDIQCTRSAMKEWLVTD